MTELFFVDSNVLVYRRDLAAGQKQKAAAIWVDTLWKTEAGRLSVQVLQEFYSVVTRKLSPGLPRAEAQEEVEEFFLWQPQAMTPEVLSQAWQIEQRFQLSFWDSLIVSAALRSRCAFLLSEDLQDGQEIDGTKVVSPFAHTPEEYDS